MGLRQGDNLLQIVGGQQLQHIHGRTRQQGRVHLERWVLGGGPNEGEQAALDVRQKASCWLLLKRCTSSTNTRCAAAPGPIARRLGALHRIADVFPPPSTALMLMNCASNASAISRAMGGFAHARRPHGMQLCGRPDSNASRGGMPGPSTCCWPTTSASVRAQDFNQGAGASPRGSDGVSGFRVINWKCTGRGSYCTTGHAHLKQKQRVALYLQAQAAGEIIAPTIPLIWPMAGAIHRLLLLDDVCTGRWFELEGAGGQCQVDLHALETNRRALAEAVHSVQRRQLFARKPLRARSATGRPWPLGWLAPTAIHPGQAAAV